MTVATADAVAASGAQTLSAERLPAALGFSTDTRTLGAGDAFVALRGERYDGHDFLAAALARGAAALVVEDAALVPADVPALVVADTTAAYLAFGGAARRASRAHVVAITGSAGKTTTKTFLAQILAHVAGAERVIATPLNENNEIGVAKLLLSLSPEVAYAVVEMGARHPGEIEVLARAALPDVALLVNVGEAHLEIFGSREALAATKWGIFATGARAVCNAEDAECRRRAPSLAVPPLWFSTQPLAAAEPGADVVALVRDATGDALAVRRGGREERHAAAIAVAGEHNRANVAAAAAAALALGLRAEAVAAALASLALPAGRYERMDVRGLGLIYDAYNASLSGTLATLRSFAQERAARRIAVLGGMAELGEDAAAMHREAGAAAARVDLGWLLAGGDFAGETARGAREAGFDAARIVTYGSNAEALAWLDAHAAAGDLILLKASRRYRLEEIVDGLRAAHAR